MTRKRPGADIGGSQGQLPRRIGWALGTGTVLQGFNASIIAVALVSIGAHFGPEGSAALPWLVSGMYIACAVASPSSGRFVDLFGARRLYLIGLGIVLVAAVLGPFAPSVEWLVIDRIVMGIGASVHFPAAMTIVRRLAVERQLSARNALGSIALFGQTVAAIGPTIGGLLVVGFGWQAIFWANLPLILNSALWLIFTVPRDLPLGPRDAPRPTGTAPRAPSRFVAAVKMLDVPGLILFVMALVSLMTGVIGLSDVFAGDPRPLLWMGASLPVWALLLVRETRAASPFLDVRLLTRNPKIVATCAQAILTFVGFYAVFYGMPQWFEVTRGLSPAGAGLLMIPVFGAGVLSTMLAMRVGARIRPRALMIIGGAGFAIAGTFLAISLTADAPWWLMVAVGALLGLPNGFNNLGNQNLLQSTSPPDSVGVVMGLYRTSQYVGAALSTAVVTLLLVNDAPDGGIHSLGAIIGGVGVVLALFNLTAAIRERRNPIESA